MINPKPGKYKHVKSGKIYKVLGIARHSETLEELVVYRGQYDSKEFGKNPLWVRPLEMFLKEIEINGKRVSRFEYLGEQGPFNVS